MKAVNIISSNDLLSSRFYQCFSVSLICLLLEAAKLTATHTKLLLFDPLSPSLFLSLKFGWTCKEETSAASIESKEFQNKNSTLRGFSNVQEHFVAHFWLWLWCSWGFVFFFELGNLNGSKQIKCFYYYYYFLFHFLFILDVFKEKKESFTIAIPLSRNKRAFKYTYMSIRS